ncbi:hypothetical protein [Candidatus Methylacidiphilum infernorum]|uniref:Uncharacterized protein n=1 Tax=Methylacidiphilum infernorum (isolate V4) TaxID=481448 RepID=B3DW31_METI4|nr:hypothetical protein [Candidatus Methylacidiphilum infernorum]ACD83534.1 Hypothetical protein Minf_1480 [Methylacidiphilum infernorum V4]
MDKNLFFYIWIFFLLLIHGGSSLFSLTHQHKEIEQKVSAILYKDLYPEAGEKIVTLNIDYIDKKKTPAIVASWLVHLVDDGLHYKPLFHPPSTLDTEEVYGMGRFRLKENFSVDLNDPLTKQGLESWREKLIKVRDLMRQVVVLRCMYFCRHNYGKNTESDLNSALAQLHNLAIQEKPKTVLK